MHGKLKGNSVKRRASLGEYAILLLIGVFAFILARSLHSRGTPQKWGTAIMATFLTFGFVTYAFRQRLRHWAFWVSLSVCFVVHTAVVWVFFSYVLYDVDKFSVLLWLPVMLIEVFALLILVKRIERKLGRQTGDN